MTEKRLDENTINRLQETIDIHRTSRKLVLDWKERLMKKCKDCLRERLDKYVPKGDSGECDCDVQMYLDIIIELLGNGYSAKKE